MIAVWILLVVLAYLAGVAATSYVAARMGIGQHDGDAIAAAIFWPIVLPFFTPFALAATIAEWAEDRGSR